MPCLKRIVSSWLEVAWLDAGLEYESITFTCMDCEWDKDINRCFELQIEAIFTDYPEKALQLKENYER